MLMAQEVVIALEGRTIWAVEVLGERKEKNFINMSDPLTQQECDSFK